MNYTSYRWCVVSSCKNTSLRTPEKLFIKVPEDINRRNLWLELSKRDPKSLSLKSRLYLCEDHFNLEQDMDNYMEYKIMGSVKQVKMKSNTIPTIFYSNGEGKHKLSSSNSQSTLTNIQKMDFVQDIENSKLGENYMVSSIKSDVPIFESEEKKVKKATQMQSSTTGKSIQLEKYMANYFKDKMGFTSKITMVNEAVPIKFHCQENENQKRKKLRGKTVQRTVVKCKDSHDSFPAATVEGNIADEACTKFCKRDHEEEIVPNAATELLSLYTDIKEESDISVESFLLDTDIKEESDINAEPKLLNTDIKEYSDINVEPILWDTDNKEYSDINVEPKLLNTDNIENSDIIVEHILMDTEVKQESDINVELILLDTDNKEDTDIIVETILLNTDVKQESDINVEPILLDTDITVEPILLNTDIKQESDINVEPILLDTDNKEELNIDETKLLSPFQLAFEHSEPMESDVESSSIREQEVYEKEIEMSPPRTQRVVVRDKELEKHGTGVGSRKRTRNRNSPKSTGSTRHCSDVSPPPQMGSDGEDPPSADDESHKTDSDDEDSLECELGGRDACAEPARPALSRAAAMALHDEDVNNDRALEDIASADFCDFNWSTSETDFEARRETFTGTPGPTFCVTTILDLFYRMIDNDFVDMLCVETNRYASKNIILLKKGETYISNSQLHWTPTDRNEMITFLAIVILQSLYPLPKEESHFSFNGYGTMPYFSEIMSRERYIILQKLFCFSDISTTGNHARGTKIAPVTKYFNNKFSNLYYPSQEVVLDEYRLTSQRRLGFAQKLPSNSIQSGVKTYELAESSSGYLWRFFVSTGREKAARTTNTYGKRSRSYLPADHTYSRVSDERKRKGIGHIESRRIPEETNTVCNQKTNTVCSDRLIEKNKQTANKGNNEGNEQTNEQIIHESTAQKNIKRQCIATRMTGDKDGDGDILISDKSVASLNDASAAIIYRLIGPLLGLGHTLIIDNFYNCPLLAQILKNHKTDCFGTLRLSREFVPDSLTTLTKADIRENEVVTQYCTDLVVGVWRDGYLISMISTYHPLRSTKENDRLPQKSDIVRDYNKSMRRVDKKDHILSTHPMESHDRVWYINLFYRLLNSAVFNCYVIYKTGKQEGITHRQFRRELAESLLLVHRKLFFKVYKDQNVGDVTSRMAKIAHFPSKLDVSGASCEMCFLTKRTKVPTSHKCAQCQIPLCILPCFMEYHKMMSNKNN